jgi:hypothetical protein
MDPRACPRCGLRDERRPDGIARYDLAVPGLRLSAEDGVSRPARPAVGALLDAVMNWVVGMLLLVSVTVLVFFQARPPR